MESESYLRGFTQSQKELYELRINNRDYQLPIMKSIDLLAGCMNLGKQAARKVEGKDVVIIIGDSGAGKSTFINYVHGCKMECVKASDMNIRGLGWIYFTKDRALMPIGHGKVSKTFIPHVATDRNGITWVDCPG